MLSTLNTFLSRRHESLQKAIPSDFFILLVALFFPHSRELSTRREQSFVLLFLFNDEKDASKELSVLALFNGVMISRRFTAEHFTSRLVTLPIARAFLQAIEMAKGRIEKHPICLHHTFS
jgi:hypothetical protein